MLRRIYVLIAILCWCTHSSALLNQTECFLNKSLTWDTVSDQCVDNASNCTQRLDSLSCLRDGLCWWIDNSQTCFTRSIPSALIEIDTACRSYFNYTDIIFSGETCMQDARCEFDAYSMNCLVNRALTCATYETAGACDSDLQCMYATSTSECVPFSYDYEALCYGFSCNLAHCSLVHGMCTVGRQGRRDLINGPIALFCRTNTLHPFTYPCSNVSECSEVCADSLHSPYCKLALDLNVVDLCVPDIKYAVYEDGDWNQRYNNDNIVLIPGLVLVCVLFALLVCQIFRPTKHMDNYKLY